MRTYKNHDVHSRTWVSLTRPDGRTLELGPGEECDLDLPDDFDDPHLRAVRKAREVPKAEVLVTSQEGT